MAETDLNRIPALQPPEGRQSNFVNPTTLMPAVIGTSTVILTLITLLVAARAFVKTFLVREHHIEDWFCYWAWAGVVTYTGILIYIEDYGFARHQWDVSAAMMQHIMYYINILYCIYAPTTLPAKLSVLFQIKRIFTTKQKNIIYWVMWGSIIANIIFYTGLFFSYVFQCWPRAAIWDPSIHGKCVSGDSSNLAAGILNVISDVEALLLPVWAIWHLKMPVKRKLAVSAVFGVGLIACVIGMVGLYFRVILLQRPDFTWICTKAALLVISEMTAVVIVGCFPSIPRLVRYMTERREGSKSEGTEQSASRTYSGRWDPTAQYKRQSSQDHLELHRYPSDGAPQGTRADRILKTTRVEQVVGKSEV